MLDLIVALALAATAQPADGGTRWRANEGDREFQLFNGPASDRSDIVFRCARRGGSVVRLSIDGLYTGDGPEPRRLTVRSGRYRITAALGPDRTSRSAGTFAATIPLASAPLAAFARTGRLTLQARNIEMSGDAGTRLERMAIARFFRSCSGRSIVPQAGR